MRTKVLYVVGTQRGGTTIAGRLMGELPGFAFVGELRKLWQVGLAEGRACGCGLGYEVCGVWSAVVPAMLATTDVATMQRWQRAAAPDHRSSLQAWRLARGGVLHGSSAVRSYATLLGATYSGLASATGADVIIDTSKLPADAVLMSDLDGIDAYLLQLVRDPRGTVYSAIRRSSRGRGRRLRQAISGSTGWTVRHAAGAALRRRLGPRRSLVVTYEDLVAHPNAVLARIAGFLGQTPPAAPIVVGRDVQFGVAHTPIGGGRFRPTSVELARDDRWMTSLGTVDSVVVSTLTRPLARHFGYLFTARESRRHVRSGPDGIPFSPSRPPGV